MKGDHAPTFTLFFKIGFIDGMLFKFRFPRVAEYLSITTTGVTTTGEPTSSVAVSKTLETSISWNPSAATISHAFFQGSLQGFGGPQQLLGLQFHYALPCCVIGF
jgi:hypothetical protein